MVVEERAIKPESTLIMDVCQFQLKLVEKKLWHCEEAKRPLVCRLSKQWHEPSAFAVGCFKKMKERENEVKANGGRMPEIYFRSFLAEILLAALGQR